MLGKARKSQPGQMAGGSRERDRRWGSWGCGERAGGFRCSKDLQRHPRNPPPLQCCVARARAAQSRGVKNGGDCVCKGGLGRGRHLGTLSVTERPSLLSFEGLRFSGDPGHVPQTLRWKVGH